MTGQPRRASNVRLDGGDIKGLSGDNRVRC